MRDFSILKARIASLIFLARDTSDVKRKFLATCWVIVEAPSNLDPVIILFIFLNTALVIPFASIPGC